MTVRGRSASETLPAPVREAGSTGDADVHLAALQFQTHVSPMGVDAAPVPPKRTACPMLTSYVCACEERAGGDAEDGESIQFTPSHVHVSASGLALDAPIPP